MSKTASFWLVAALAAGAAAPAGAQQQQQAPAVDSAHVRELLAQAQQQVAPPASGQAGERFVTPGARVDLGLDEAVARSLDKNIDIGVARITPRLTDFTIAGLEAQYRLNLTSNINNISNTSFPTQTTQGITTNTTTTTQNWSAGLAQNVYWGGGSYTVNWANRRLNNPSAVNLRNPTITSGITGTLNQPLLRGFRIDATRASLKTNRLSQTERRDRADGDHGDHRRERARTRTGIWSTAISGGAKPRRTRSTLPPSWCRTTSRASKSARWRRSTSCRRRPSRPPAGRRSCRRRRRSARRSSR